MFLISPPNVVKTVRVNTTELFAQCDQTVTLTQFFEDIAWSSPSKVGFIGGGCENATIETAKISYFFNLTQVGVSTVEVVDYPLSGVPGCIQIANLIATSSQNVQPCLCNVLLLCSHCKVECINLLGL